MMYSPRRGKAPCDSLSEFFGVYSLHTRDHCCASDVYGKSYVYFENIKATAMKEAAVSHNVDEFEI